MAVPLRVRRLLQFVHRNQYLKTGLKIGATLLAIAYLVHSIPMRNVVAQLAELNAASLALLALPIAGQKLFTALSLRELAREYSPASLAKIVEINEIGFLTNSIIPTRAGAVLSVPVLINRYLDITIADAGRVKATQFVFTSFYTAIFTFIGLIFSVQLIGIEASLVYLGAIGLYMLVPVTAVLANYQGERIIHYLPGQVRDYVEKASEGRFSRRRLLIAGGFVLTYFLFIPIRFFIISTAFDVQFTWILYVALPILAYSVTIYPISFGGIGVAEASGTFLLTAIGVPPEIAAAVIVTDRMAGAYIPLAIAGVIVTVASFRSAVTS